MSTLKKPQEQSQAPDSVEKSETKCHVGREGSSRRSELLLLLMSDLAAQHVFVERPKLSFLRVEPPAPEDDSQTRHHRNREEDAENAGDLAAGHHTRNCREGM